MKTKLKTLYFAYYAEQILSMFYTLRGGFYLWLNMDSLVWIEYSLSTGSAL